MPKEWTYDQVVTLCEVDGVPLPEEFVEWVAEKLTMAANRALDDDSPSVAEAAGASSLCAQCGHPWSEHDFGVPAPQCP